MIAKRGSFEVHLWKTGLSKTGLTNLRTRSVSKIHAQLAATGLPAQGTPRLSQVVSQPWGMREFTLVDPEGNVLRIGRVLIGKLQVTRWMDRIPIGAEAYRNLL